jgi:hypothetical protein
MKVIKKSLNEKRRETTKLLRADSHRGKWFYPVPTADKPLRLLDAKMVFPSYLCIFGTLFLLCENRRESKLLAVVLILEYLA